MKPVLTYFDLDSDQDRKEAFGRELDRIDEQHHRVDRYKAVSVNASRAVQSKVKMFENARKVIFTKSINRINVNGTRIELSKESQQHSKKNTKKKAA